MDLRSGLLIAAWVVFIVVGNRLGGEAEKHLKRRRLFWVGNPILDPTLYEPTGEAARARALRFYRIGIVVLILVSIALLS